MQILKIKEVGRLLFNSWEDMQNRKMAMVAEVDDLVVVARTHRYKEFDCMIIMTARGNVMWMICYTDHRQDYLEEIA
jgi:hypothetical protein